MTDIANMRARPTPPADTTDFTERRRRIRIHSTTQGWLIPDVGTPTDPWEVRIDDISRHGIGFQTTAKMDRGQLCRIRIGYGPNALARRIRVVTCRRWGRRSLSHWR